MWIFELLFFVSIPVILFCAIVGLVQIIRTLRKEEYYVVSISYTKVQDGIIFSSLCTEKVSASSAHNAFLIATKKNRVEDAELGDIDNQTVMKLN